MSSDGRVNNFTGEQKLPSSDAKPAFTVPPSPSRAKSLQLPPLVYPDNHAPIVMHDSSPPLQNAPASSHAPSARHPVAPSAASDGPSHRIHSPVAAVSCSRDGSLVECELRVAHHCEQGVRGSMEDEVIIEQNIDINGSSSPLRGPLSFYAVCDGHGGKNAAIFTRDNLNRVLMDDIKAGKEVPEALTAAFIKVDKDFIASGKDPSGTTAATLLLDQATGNVWVANVGDSRVVLSRAGEALPLSRDHRCDRQDEVERIRKAGGFVIQSRVMGELAVTRSIGDADFKDDELNLVIAEPEIEHNRLQDDDEFVLIACDGLFDVMTNEAAIAYVRQHLRKHNDPERAARDLVYHAIHELNTRDNVSVVLICLKDDYSAVVTPSS